MSQTKQKVASITKIECKEAYFGISLIYVKEGTVQISLITDEGLFKYMQATVKDQIF